MFLRIMAVHNGKEGPLSIVRGPDLVREVIDV